MSHSFRASSFTDRTASGRFVQCLLVLLLTLFLAACGDSFSESTDLNTTAGLESNASAEESAPNLNDTSVGVDSGDNSVETQILAPQDDSSGAGPSDTISVEVDSGANSDETQIPAPQGDSSGAAPSDTVSVEVDSGANSDETQIPAPQDDSPEAAPSDTGSVEADSGANSDATQLPAPQDDSSEADQGDTDPATDTTIGDSVEFNGAFIDSSNALERWADVVGVINEDRVNSFFASLEQELNFFERIFFGTNVQGLIPGERITVNPPYRFIEDETLAFDVSEASVTICTAGGQIVRYASQANSGGTGDDAVFENCVVGENEYRGTAGNRDLGRGVIGRQPFINFQRIASNGAVQTINGETFSGNTSFVNRNLMFGSRNLSFSDSTDGFSLSDYNIEQTDVDTSGVGFFGETTIVDGNTIRIVNYVVGRTIDGQFTVRAPFTNGEPCLLYTSPSPRDRG